MSSKQEYATAELVAWQAAHPQASEQEREQKIQSLLEKYGLEKV